MSSHPLLALPIRFLLPLLAALLALPFGWLAHEQHTDGFVNTLREQESRLLAERLATTHTRLEVQIARDPMLVRRLVSGLGVHQDLTHAWLTNEEGRVIGALVRRELDRPLRDVLADQYPAFDGLDALLAQDTAGRIRIDYLADEQALIGQVGVRGAGRLIIRSDLDRPIAAALHANRKQVALEVGALIAFALLLGVLLHFLWFKRAARLTATANALGLGRLDARASLSGSDELAQIGNALDGMASRVQQQHHRLEQLAQLIAHSPVVAFVWANEPGWPAIYVSENITQWGYSREAFTSGALHFSDLIHPEDLSRIETEVAGHLANGPDQYIQEYRLQQGDGSWFWVEDRTWLTRDSAGTVLSIQGVLLDITERKRADSRLRESLTQFETIANASPVLFWTSGLDKGCDWFNDVWLNFTGRGLEQELGDGWVEGIHPDDRTQCVATYVRAFDAREPFSMEYRLRRHDGTYRWLIDHGLPRFDADGHFIGFIGSCLDITDERLARDALRESEARLKEAQQMARIGNWTLELPDGPLLWSDQIFRIFEIDPARFGASYEAFLECVHPEDRDTVDAAYRRSLETREPYAIAHRLQFPDGRIKHVQEHCETEYDEDDRPLRSRGTVQDITERVMAEQALRDSEERLRLALMAAKQGLYDLDLNTGEAKVSAEYATMVGFDPDTFQETHTAWRARLHPEDAPEVFRTFDKYVAGELPEYRVEFRMRTRDGRWKWILSMGKILEWSADGQPLRMLGTHTDIDALKQAQTALRELNTTLEARVEARTAELQLVNESLESFVYSVSHDLKTPLRGIEGYSRLLQEEYANQLDQEGRLFIVNIRWGVNRMSELIDDLLAYARMERTALAPSAIAPEQLLRSILEEREPELSAKGIRTTLDFCGDCLIGDPNGLSIVIRNLIENAIKFSADTPNPTIEIGSKTDADTVTLWVRDNGIGFDMKYGERIFELFQRLQRTENYPGTGIGLALVRKAVQRMGGTVWAEGEPGRGACFFVRLPKA